MALAQQRASGALEISSNPGGIVFLSGGYLTFAESSAVPDLRTRLVYSQRLSDEQWSQVIESDPAHGGVGALLVSHEIITINELRFLLWSITLDALIALAMPLLGEARAVGIRFWPRRSHWVGSLLRLDVTSVWADVEQRLDRLALHNIPAQAHLQWCDLSRPWAVVTNEQWMVACQSAGAASVKDLAWRNGFALCDTMEWAGELVQSGLCTVTTSAAAVPVVMADALKDAGPGDRRPVYKPRFEERRARREGETGSPGRGLQREIEPASGRTRPSSGPVTDVSPPSRRPDGAVLPLPQRNPGETLAARAKIPGGPQIRQIPSKAPHPDLLRRILRGLRRTE